MELVVVGCSGSFPGPDSASSCYLVEHDGTRIVLDLGNGALGSLARFVDIYDVDAVIISHLHVDHFVDLCSYYVALKYRPGGPARPLPVWGPSDTGRRLVTAYGLRGNETVSSEFEIRDLEPEFTIGPFTIKTTRLVHPVEAYGIRVEADGEVLAYSGDTGPTERLVDFARDADVALFEASFLEGERNPTDLHMTSREAAEHAARAGAKRLILTHLVPWNDRSRSLAEAHGHFSGPIHLAEQGMRMKVGQP